jgi:hypothetical protein
MAEMFAHVGRDKLGRDRPIGEKLTGARKALGYVAQGGDPRNIMDAARLLVFFKGNDSHDYKFSSALLEDFAHVSPDWRGRLLAAGMMNFKGSDEKELGLVNRTRAALKG